MISAAGADKKAGFDVRLLTSGTRKADGHLHAPIDETAVKVEMQRVEKLATAFFRLAGQARGISVNKIRSLQAGIFLGKDAIREGLADRVSSYSDLLAGTQENLDKPAAAGGNQTDRRLTEKKMNITSLIKKTKAALAATDDPKKIRLLSTSLATYSAALEAYKKTEKHIEHVKTEEGDEDEDEEEEKGEEDEDEEEEAKGAEDEKKASAAKGAEDEEKASAKADDSDDDDDDDDEDDEKGAKKAKALVQSLTGEKGAAGRGKLRAMVMLAAKAVGDVEALKKDAKRREKAELIAGVTGKYFTPKEAKELAAMPLNEVRSLVAFAKKRGPMVHTEEGTLLVPRDANAKPGTEESLPKETRAMIDAAVSAAHGDKEKIRAELVAAHTKARANGAATEGRY
jgi:ClpP class serine protease